MKRTVHNVVVPVLLATAALFLHLAGVKAATRPPVTIYYNRACADCLTYVQGSVVPLLQQAGYTDLAYKDYINEPANRVELLDRSDSLGVPASLQSHLTVLVGDRLILEGHIPEGVVSDLLAAPADAFDRLLVYQDRMQGATDYTAWAFRGEPQTYAIDAPVGDYLGYLEEHGDLLAPASVATAE
jgi:hypothetical protein